MLKTFLKAFILALIFAYPAAIIFNIGIAIGSIGANIAGIPWLAIPFGFFFSFPFFLGFLGFRRFGFHNRKFIFFVSITIILFNLIWFWLDALMGLIVVSVAFFIVFLGMSFGWLVKRISRKQKAI